MPAFVLASSSEEVSVRESLRARPSRSRRGWWQVPYGGWWQVPCGDCSSFPLHTSKSESVSLPEIAHFEVTAAVREEDVARLQVAVQHLVLVHVLHREAELHKVAEHRVLRQQPIALSHPLL